LQGKPGRRGKRKRPDSAKIVRNFEETKNNQRKERSEKKPVNLRKKERELPGTSPGIQIFLGDGPEPGEKKKKGRGARNKGTEAAAAWEEDQLQENPA